MHFGCAWYPEHWDESRWGEDLRLMRGANMNVVRVAEFAWSRLEPREGVFDFDWLERAVALAAGNGIQSVIGTPTAAPPAWLTQRYPQVLRVNPDGTVARHGGRCHFNPASLTYRRFCARIAGQLAQRFGQNPAVIGWQIDNEYGVFSWDPWTRGQFQQFLKAKYETLDHLNESWSTAYWSQEYTDWSQIELGHDGQNPCLMAEFRRFFTHVYREYQHVQVDAIRRHARAEQFITHNFHGSFVGGDNHIIAQELDFASWDPYVATGHLKWADFGLLHDMVRGFKRKNFWVIETQPGFVNWSPLNNALDRGEMRSMAWHLAGHGADAVLYWQWRSAPGGQEQYHGSIVGQSGRPRPIYGEVQQIGQEFARLSDLLAGTSPAARVAMLYDDGDRWAVNQQKHTQAFDAIAHMQAYYRPLRQRGVDVDVIAPMSGLADYRLVIAPHLHMVDDALAGHLLRYAESGGHLLLGMRSGMKDKSNALLPVDPPGPFAAALGAHVEEFYALEEEIGLVGGIGRGRAGIYAEWLMADADDAEVVLRYAGHSWLDGQPALITRKYGQGRISYLAAWPDDAFMVRLTDWMLNISSALPAYPPPPDGVEICQRRGGGRHLWLLINHTDEPRTLELPAGMTDHLTGQRVGPIIPLAPRQVMVLA